MTETYCIQRYGKGNGNQTAGCGNQQTVGGAAVSRRRNRAGGNAYVQQIKAFNTNQLWCNEQAPP